MKKLMILPVFFHAMAMASTAPAKAPVAKDVSPVKAAPAAAADASSFPQFPLKAGKLDFYALGKPSMLKIHGESSGLNGALIKKGNIFTGKFEIPLETFETGMKVRDNHLKEKVFETEKFKTAILSIESLSVPEGKLGKIANIPFTGKLNFHGVEKPVTGTTDLDVSEKDVKFVAKLDVNLTDYKITPPEFMGMKIQDQVKIEAQGTGAKQ